MCNVNRRGFLIGGSAFLSVAAEADLLARTMRDGMAEAAKADLVAPDVYFHEGQVSDTADAVCNNGWIMFEDYVLAQACFSLLAVAESYIYTSPNESAQ